MAAAPAAPPAPASPAKSPPPEGVQRGSGGGQEGGRNRSSSMALAPAAPPATVLPATSPPPEVNSPPPEVNSPPPEVVCGECDTTHNKHAITRLRTLELPL
eukprot:691559-Prorocentrum_minimum.AAC.1